MLLLPAAFDPKNNESCGNSIVTSARDLKFWTLSFLSITLPLTVFVPPVAAKRPAVRRVARDGT